VHWAAEVCVHSGRCVAALPAVFRPADRPWIHAGAAAADQVAAAVEQCPSGALRHTRTTVQDHDQNRDQNRDQRAEETTVSETPQTSPTPTVTPPATVITVSVNGPNLVAGPVEIRNEAGELIRTANRVALCRCGGSENKPFCDGTHKQIGFTDPGPSPQS
jgi:CDGSH-type Zn-finger protein/uncharacterized Fe-S cluster protein YjdI